MGHSRAPLISLAESGPIFHPLPGSLEQWVAPVLLQ